MIDFQEESDIGYNNVFADTVTGNTIHISQAESGQKGYFCKGCKKELQAVRHRVQNRIDYFRHVPVDVKYEQKCTYRDETYRHKLAKEALARLKHIKVPSVYKYPPPGEEGLANLLVEPILIEAHSVEMERAFYEDEFGEIKWGSGQGVNEKYLLVRPDIVFFDADKRPILFIELVATHKADNEKKAKLRRLGINTIEISVPKDTEAAIEASLYNTKRIKWLYNHVEQSSNYISVPYSTSEGIPQIDEQQKRLFAETFECRRAEINNLIRTITRVLESKQFGDSIKQLREELSRVKGNTEEHRSKLDNLREEYRDRAFKSIERKEEEFRKETDQFEQQKTGFQKYSSDLETRYYTKRNSLANEQDSINGITAGEGSGGGNSSIFFEIRRSDLERAKIEIEELIRKEEEEIAGIQREEDGLPKRFEQLRNAAIQRFNSLETKEVGEIDRIEQDETNEPAKFEREEGKLSREFERDKEQLQHEFERTREDYTQATQARDGKGNTQLHYGIRGLLETRGLLDDIGKAQSDNRRNRQAWEALKNGSYKNWNE